jgi:hypothetical protein
MVGVKRCIPCRQRYLTWSKFVGHLVEFHHLNRSKCWRRANQIGDWDCALVESDRGDTFLMVQSDLGL